MDRAPDPTAEARLLVASAKRVVALTGAGISTGSGIPDFRGPKGVWTKDPTAERRSTLDAYMGDRSVRERAWQGRLRSPAWTAEPGPGHRALAALERQGQLHLLVTQNIDGLHQRAGEADPACLDCGGILKSATISFGQSLVPEDLARAEAASRVCDLLLAVGTTLAVHPAAGLVPLAASHGAAVVIVNAEPTPFDELADAVVRDPITTSLPVIAGAAEGRVPGTAGPPA